MPMPYPARTFNTSALYLPPFRDDQDTFPVVVLAGFRIGAYITDGRTLYVGVDSEEADPALRIAPGAPIPIEFRIDQHPVQRGWCG